MSNYEIIPYRSEFKDEVVELRRHSYSTDFPESREYLEWKYEHNPYLSEPIFYLARSGGRVIGMRGFYGARWEFGPARDSMVIPCADDFAIALEHRNTGVATLIMKFALEDMARRGFEYTINTSGGRLTVLSSLAMGWKSVGAMEPVVRRSRGEALRHGARERVRKVRGGWRLVRDSGAVLIPSQEPFRRLDRMGRVAARDPGAFLVAGAAPRPAEMAALVERLPYDGRIRQVRGAAFFAWRHQSPIRQYHFLFYEKDGRLDGYLTLVRLPEYQTPMAPFSIVDWEGTTAGVREELLLCALRAGSFPMVSAWFGTLSLVDRSLLTREGFVPSDPEARAHGLPCVLLKKLGSPAPLEPWMLGGASALDASRWDMRMIYSMHG